MKKRLFFRRSTLLICGFSSLLCACGHETIQYTKSETLNVTMIDNLPDDFILGMDASSTISLENSGVKYYDFEGEEKDVFETLSRCGINYIRVRVWNDPYDRDGHGYGGGNCDINTAIKIGKRATAYGMKMLVDFHYSDFWADPAKQSAPKAWINLSIDDKANALFDYTIDCLKKLKAANIEVGMIQVGNETNGMLCGETDWHNICQLMQAGSEACRRVYKDALVAVHFTNPEVTSSYDYYASMLSSNNVDYDVFSSSYYPYWHGTLDNLSLVLSNVATKYNKKVMVAETSYCYTSEDHDFFANTISKPMAITEKYPYSVQGQADCVRDTIDTIVNKTKNGIGVFYWEGTWIPVGTNSWEENKNIWEEYGSGWASSYSVEYDPEDAGVYYGGCAVDNQALFDQDGKPLESLKLFNLIKTGNII